MLFIIFNYVFRNLSKTDKKILFFVIENREIDVFQLFYLKIVGRLWAALIRPSQKCINLTRPSQFFKMFFFPENLHVYHFCTHKIDFLENLFKHYFYRWLF